MSKKLDRRRFLAAAAAATGAFAAGFRPSSSANAADSSWGDLTGRFVYDGPTPERIKLPVDKDVECCGKFDIRDESIIIDKGGGLKNLYIYVRSKVTTICGDLLANVEKRMVLDNIDCVFKPHCMSIWYPHQEFFIVNSDPVAQNVSLTPMFDKAMNCIIEVGRTATYRFSRPERKPLPVACNYHPWESAYVLPLDHPYVAISRDDGSFTIPRLPVGTLEFQIWHERTSYLSTKDWPNGRLTMEIKPGENNLGTVILPPSMFVKRS